MDTPSRDKGLGPPTAPDGLVVLFEDNHLLVVDKPAGLLCQAAQAGDDNLVDRAREWLRARYAKPGNVYVGLVHRLDRNTSGVVVLARTSKAAARMSALFARAPGAGPIAKRYLAVVEGLCPAEATLVHTLAEVDHGVRVSAGGKRAELRYERLTSAGGLSLLSVELLTGRKHQIRAQLAAAGHPIVGDRRYGSGQQALLPRPALHAASLCFEHPVRRTPLEVRAPLPADIAALCARHGLPMALGSLESAAI